MIRVKSLWMDYEEQLTGVEDMPLFGWVMESDGRNVCQAAYQLQLAQDGAFAQPVYDSGRIESDESAHVEVAGVTLRACTRYAARVRVWTVQEESAWSAPAFFLTGMANRPWRGKFISA